MAKRKRDVRDEGSRPGEPPSHKESSRASIKAKQTPPVSATGSETIQIVTGSYDRVLHGFTAAFDLSQLDLNDSDVQPEVSFADTFMFNAHSSAIRCLALSPLTSEAGGVPAKVLLASGGSDEKINVYTLSANAPSTWQEKLPSTPSLSSVARAEDPRNREIGSLIHHSSNITQLCFASKSKLLSSSEDNTIAVSRTRDWTVLTTFKAPLPKIQGRPSGDTAPPGGAPTGVNDFSIHPSNMLMMSVGKGERTMRSWDLVKGKKAGALDFDRDLLIALGETKHTTGEARSILFAPDGEDFVVSFDRGAAVYNRDCRVQGLVVPSPKTKLHKMRFLPGECSNILAVSTDDGRVLFFDTQQFTSSEDAKNSSYKICKQVGQLGGPGAGVATRIKSLEIIQLSGGKQTFAVVTACSDGSVRIWYLGGTSLSTSKTTSSNTAKKEKTNGFMDSHDTTNDTSNTSLAKVPQVGKLLGRYDTAHRITCMEAFKMLPALEDKVVTIDVHGGVAANASANRSRTDTQLDGAEDEDVEDEFEGFD